MQAMDFLPPANRVALGETVEGQVTAEGKDVIVIGGGDTGADCIGTSHRQGARSVTSLEIMPQPPEERVAGQPWPTYPMIFRVASAHEEGGERVYAVVDQGDPRRGRQGRGAPRSSRSSMGDEGFEEVEGTERVMPAQLVLLAMGFLGPEGPGCRRAARGRARRALATSSATRTYMTSVPGVFVAGDAGRGQSLIVWAIAEGRSAAAGSTGS